MSRDINTLSEGQILLNYQLVDEVLFPQKFLRMGLKAFRLEKLSNGHIQDVPAIIGAHPLAVIRGMINSGESASQIIDSKLPMVGVEQMTGTPHTIPLGVAQTQKYDVTPEFLTLLRATPVDERMFTEDLIDDIEHIKNDRAEKLFLYANSILKHSGVRISCWSASFEVNRLMKKCLESLMIEFYRAVQEFGVKPEDYTLEPALYNFDIGEILYGCEISLPYLIRNMNYLIDINMEEIAEFDIAVFNSTSVMTISPFGIPEERHVFMGPDSVI